MLEKITRIMKILLHLIFAITIAVFLIASLSMTAVVAAGVNVDPTVLRAEAERVTLIEQVQPSVLAVFSGMPDRPGGGSGVLISPDGYALTNFHVVQPCGPYMKCGTTDGKLYDAVLVGLDPTGDIALIKLLGRNDFPIATLGDSDTVRQGDPAFAMGNPFLLASNLKPTVSYGIVSGLRRYQYPSDSFLEYTDCIQTDAAINPGNSGGPLFNERGELIGINGRCSFEKRGRVSVGVGYAVSINQIKKFIGPLRSGRIVDHATLGATAAFDDKGHVVVDDILAGSDVFRRGLRYGDQIIRVAGRTIESPNALKNLLGTFPAAWRVPITFRRDGQDFTIYTRLAYQHYESDLLNAVKEKLPQPMPIPERNPGEEHEDGQQPDTPDAPKVPGVPDMQKLLAAAGKQPELPEKIKSVYEERIGFANFYFNTLENRQVQNAWSKEIQRDQLLGDWTLQGRTEANQNVRLLFDREGITSELGTEGVRWNAEGNLTERLDPPGTGGLFPTLHLWHRLTTLGGEAFDSLDYQGTYPAPFPQKENLAKGEPVLRDVLVGRTAGAECWFYFDREKGLLTEIELFARPGDDSCLVQLLDYKSFDGRFAPSRLDIYYGDKRFSPIVIDNFTVGK